jgi:hypothetical protein
MRERYPVNSYALFPEVRNATGFKGDRAADAVVIGLWPSRGLEVEGFEFKISRGDWLRELKDPRKADGVAVYCDRWWVVAGKPGIVKPDELPKTWGLLVAQANGLRAAVQAPPMTPQALDRAFVASMCRAAQKHADKEIEKAAQPAKDELWRITNEVRQKYAASHAQEVEQARESERKRWDGYVARIKEFERLSGVDLFRSLEEGGRWRLGSVAAAVKFLCEAGNLNSITYIAKQLASLAEAAKEAAAEVEKLKPTESA